MIVLAVALALTVADPPAPPVDCHMIRAHIAQHGKLAAYAWAIANGYSPKDIARIRKVCGV
ncbi:hypothetical protein [Bradyrhizobium icense]|uniref:Uncharacterized protein n=1 Tax=Bradyrhizobium icense TaxID=1274631 RepID=A0A1B1UD60_9BRAD|nr:hypothetical protein [Bradyrhizobium icense]ANW00697.1 hypothetical protein LMTR13_11465 [Bradyrhizobium icense]